MRFYILLLFFFSISNLDAQDDSLTTNGKASFYHDKFQGRITSNGEEYNQDDFTAAHRTLPFNTIVHVTNKQNNKSVVVRINDRGPFKKSRIIDLTRAAAKKLDMIPFGVVPVKIKPLTFLDRSNLNDSMIFENDVWDCFAHKVDLADSVIYLWQTASVKHAFYMASDLLLCYHLPNVYVKAFNTPSNRKYAILIPCEQLNAGTKSLIKTLRTDGFQHAHLMSN